MAQPHHPRDRRHRQAAAVGGADRLVALSPQRLTGRFPGGQPFAVVLGKGS